MKLIFRMIDLLKPLYFKFCTFSRFTRIEEFGPLSKCYWLSDDTYVYFYAKSSFPRPKGESNRFHFARCFRRTRQPRKIGLKLLGSKSPD